MNIAIRSWMITLLRISLAIVFIWFGALKVFDVSPVVNMVVEVYDFLPQPLMFDIVGALEVIIGLALLFNVFVRTALVFLWGQMFGVFLSLILEPAMFFTNGNIFLITMDGEFIIKNIVFITASIILFEAQKKQIVPTMKAVETPSTSNFT